MKHKDMETVYLGIGTNLGDRRANIQQALQLLDEVDGINVLQHSSIYETEPVGYLDQPFFFNLVCQLRTKLTPQQLLHQLQRIEQTLKRVRTVRWGPRTIDLDILLFGTRIVDQPNLTIPHPRMLQRSFVMIPLAELAPDLIIPGTEQTVLQWKERCIKRSTSLVRKVIPKENWRKEEVVDASDR